MNREECDDEEVCQFLILLKRPKGLMPDKEDELQTNEWKQVVFGAKKRCTSSVFSMRDYSVHKYALENNVVVVVLAKFYNFVI